MELRESDVRKQSEESPSGGWKGALTSGKVKEAGLIKSRYAVQYNKNIRLKVAASYHKG